MLFLQIDIHTLKFANIDYHQTSQQVGATIGVFSLLTGGGAEEMAGCLQAPGAPAEVPGLVLSTHSEPHLELPLIPVSGD